MKRLACLLLLAPALGSAQQGASSDIITAVPNRPTVSNPADPTQRGVLEIEEGIAAAPKLQELQGLLKFGLTRDFELRLGSNSFQHDATIHTIGIGDTTVGFKYRFLHQNGAVPALAIGYAAKLATASGALGSGQIDHQLTALASKDFGLSHFDVNLNLNWFGRRGHASYTFDVLPTLSWSHPLGERLKKFDVEAEVWGESSPVASQPASISTLYALAYTVKPRLVLDAGASFGHMGPVPAATFLAGFTYSIADLYHHRAASRTQHHR